MWRGWVEKDCMKQFEFNRCSFQISSNGKISLPKQNLPHFVLAGRSNVGKSSFINHLFQKKNLAKTSSKPGKTQLLNFYNIDDRIFFVDIPGYGYAKTNKGERDKWRRMIEGYVSTYLEKITFIHFIDGRHEPSESDWDFIHWAKESQKKVLFIITKMDKVKTRDRKKVKEELSKTLDSFGTVVFYNIEEKSVRQNVKDEINRTYFDEQS